MKCQNCGSEFEGKFCTNCGTAAGQTVNAVVQPNPVSKPNSKVTCSNCGSTNVNVQVVNEVYLKNEHHGCLWWCFIGCWWVPVKWLFLTLPALIFKIFGHKKQKAINKQKTICVCQDCGKRWEK